MTTSITCVGFTVARDENRLSLMQFKPDEQNRQVSVTSVLEQDLNKVMKTPGRRLTIDQVSNILDQGLGVIPPLNNNNRGFREKLAIMLIDGDMVPLGDDDLRAVSNAFRRRNIILAVVAMSTPVFETWNFYRELARHTNGEYMLFENAPCILSSVILRAIQEGDTLRQAFMHQNLGNVFSVAAHTDRTNEQQEMTDGVGDMLFDHGLC